ncbi:hypothetical protein COCSADRAFT_80381 [Bipolaris sorokiniana ND90Pr]|uniref:Uncharacterized protein n=1 Tax=Cochliobolus sativus (strain ND90Pr / ATCC 201652) TaxID=665912 RepID=M2TJ45_COCSN|nr:uncharacterized protein COCSADRAFT_80381 [Bipolaris sorokiniana ND90Pr]EMD68722.1 hypothetical protein COCSADRAFT_80381 [Bipolaris sorokiniana ND90Pr]
MKLAQLVTLFGGAALAFQSLVAPHGQRALNDTHSTVVMVTSTHLVYEICTDVARCPPYTTEVQTSAIHVTDTTTVCLLSSTPSGYGPPISATTTLPTTSSIYPTEPGILRVDYRGHFFKCLRVTVLPSPTWPSSSGYMIPSGSLSPWSPTYPSSTVLESTNVITSYHVYLSTSYITASTSSGGLGNYTKTSAQTAPTYVPSGVSFGPSGSGYPYPYASANGSVVGPSPSYMEVPFNTGHRIGAGRCLIDDEEEHPGSVYIVKRCS